MVSASDYPAYSLTRKLESIANLSDEERDTIQSLPILIRTMPAHRDVVREGDRPGHCVLVIDGWVGRFKLLTEGRRQIMSIHVSGDIPDLHSLHLSPMDHSLCTLTDVTMAYIPHQNVRALTESHPNIAAIFWRDTLIEAAIFREWITNLGRRPAAQRLAHLFCEMYTKLSAVGLARDFQCPFPITQADLADATGLSTVHVNRSLQSLRAAGLITLRSDVLTIKDWGGLAKLSEFDPLYLRQKIEEAAC